MTSGIITNMIKGLGGDAWPVSFMVREVLAQRTDYVSAVNAFKSSSLMAPTYITVAGALEGEGTVITRSRAGTEAWPSWNLQEHGPVVQANMDFFRDDDRLDLKWCPNSENKSQLVKDENKTVHVGECHDWQDICDSRARRQVAQTIISRIGQDSITKLDLWELVSTPPCLAEDTVYTVAMQPATGYYVTRCKLLSSHTRQGRNKWGRLVNEIYRNSGLAQNQSNARRQ